jgi:hypothetical protein
MAHYWRFFNPSIRFGPHDRSPVNVRSLLKLRRTFAQLLQGREVEQGWKPRPLVFRLVAWRDVARQAKLGKCARQLSP